MSKVTRTLLRTAAMLLAATASSGLLAPLLGACGSESSDSTSGKRVKLATRVEVDSTDFVTGLGWHVVLGEAALSVGALYYFDGEPAFVRNERSVFGIRAAYAHPGHYQSGDALGQMLTSSSVDLLALPAGLAVGEGISGTYRSARFDLGQSALGPAASQLGAHAAIAEGVATREGDGGATQVHFRISADFGDVAKSAAAGAVNGCVFEETVVNDSGTITLTLHPAAWFNLVDFTGLPPGSADAPTEIAAGSVPHIAFALGIAQLGAYHFAFSK